MASFFEDLWNSIFTPGPTSSLLLATNISFAALQLVLAACLFATWSVHFIVLSVLSSGLWLSVNWFAKEVKAAQEAHARREEAERRLQSGTSGTSARGSSREPVDSGDDTETEAGGGMHPQQQRRAKRDNAGGAAKATSGGDSRNASGGNSSVATFNTSTAAKLASGDTAAVKQRRNLAESTGDISTDSEWEKVDNDN